MRIPVAWPITVRRWMAESSWSSSARRPRRRPRGQPARAPRCARRRRTLAAGSSRGSALPACVMGEQLHAQHAARAELVGSAWTPRGQRTSPARSGSARSPRPRPRRCRGPHRAPAAACRPGPGYRSWRPSSLDRAVTVRDRDAGVLAGVDQPDSSARQVAHGRRQVGLRAQAARYLRHPVAQLELGHPANLRDAQVARQSADPCSTQGVGAPRLRATAQAPAREESRSAWVLG